MINTKFRRLLRIGTVTTAVYLVFAWLLPLCMPFFLAWVTALTLRPSALWISEKCSFSIGKRRFRPAPGLIGGLELVLLGAALCGLFIWGMKCVGSQAGLLAEQLPGWLLEVDRVLTGFCYRLEEAFSLGSGTVVGAVQDLLRQLGRTLKQGIMPYLMGNSMAVLGCCAAGGVLLVIYLIASALFIGEMETWRKKIERSVYRTEFLRIGRVLRQVGNAYLRTQGVILLVTMAVCVMVFFFMGENYYLLEGIAVGLLDALPVFGAGTVLIPWGLFSFFRRQWGRGAVLLLLYGVCYVLRQLLEAKMMGSRVGMTALETLASVYVGIQLFGILGVLFGPVGLQLIKEFSGDSKESVSCNQPANPV